MALIALFGGSFFAGGVSGCATSLPAVAPGMAPKAATGAITGLKAELTDQESALPDGRVAWSRRWRLCWDAVPGAVAYVVTSATPEGSGAPGETTDRCFAMTVANGVAARAGERPGRVGPVDALQSLMLSFVVAARLADGTLGPSSPAVAVGRTFP